MNKKQLKNYKNRLDSWRKGIKGTKFNKEQNAIIKFVVPLLNILGWDPFSRYMEFQYHIPYGDKRRGSPDIALYTNSQGTGIPKILIEVKTVQDEINIKRFTRQIFRYMTNGKVKYGILTNGREIMLFTKFRVNPKYNRGRLLFSLKYGHFEKYADVLSVLSKDKVNKGKLDDLANAYNSKSYSDWKKKNETGSKKKDNYRLPLIFARNFLKGGNYGLV